MSLNIEFFCVYNVQHPWFKSHLHHRSELKHVSEVPCSSCDESKKELESMAAVLDSGGPGKYGELVLENLGLQRKVCDVFREWYYC